jgi:molybdopterin synthase sulfur carrier subunit
MTAEIRLPRLLEPVVGDRRRIAVEASTVGGAVEALLRELPGLKGHLFDETGRLRPHVLCFVDGSATRLDDPTIPLRDGSSVEFLQAVSGGGVPDSVSVPGPA